MPIQFLFIFIAIIIALGIFSGYKKQIIVFRNYSNAATVFLLIFLPLVFMNKIPEDVFVDYFLGKNGLQKITLFFMCIAFAYICYATFIDNNKQLIPTVYALCLKIPLSIISIPLFIIRLFPQISTHLKQIHDEGILGKSITLAQILPSKLFLHKTW